MKNGRQPILVVKRRSFVVNGVNHYTSSAGFFWGEVESKNALFTKLSLGDCIKISEFCIYVVIEDPAKTGTTWRAFYKKMEPKNPELIYEDELMPSIYNNQYWRDYYGYPK